MLQLSLIIFLLLHLRKKVRAFSPGHRWDKVFKIGLIAVVVLFILGNGLHVTFILQWVWYLVLLLLIGITYKEPVFYSSRPVLIAITPATFLFIIKDAFAALDNRDYESVKIYFHFAVAVALTWMITMLIISQRQQKVLFKERKKRQEEDEQNRIIAARKAELEMLVNERTEELRKQKEELQHALVDLKATQAQLIQKEKMASLGELTAGIAHEIQNPLNFINNFSELNVELTNELTQEINNLPEAAAAKQNLFHILNDLQQNGQKITTHGKRADAIVKGMLLHSRKTSGTKEPTDINALADEYLRLSYHGLRAKDKNFNAKVETHFDKNLEKINVVPQDMGRVLLNLFNNAFYAVTEKKKNLGNGYEPTVSVSTKKVADKIEICVKDNGMGISKSLQDKIFQPFFTTKPTGEGTGLGLSLSYDIIKAHGGELKVESTEGEGTLFIILLPLPGA